MVGIAISIAAGMLISSTGLCSPSLLFLLSFFFVAASVLFLRSRYSTALVFISIAFTAACRFLVAQPDLSADSINRMDFGEDQSVNLSGRISGFPEFHSYRSESSGLWIFPVMLEQISVSNGWKKVSGEMDLKIMGASLQLEL